MVKNVLLLDNSLQKNFFKERIIRHKTNFCARCFISRVEGGMNKDGKTGQETF